ncbi:MAG: fumarylacetoacetate hydrolase family protein [Pseudomonadota bacterium]
MKLFRHGPKSQENPGILVDGRHLDLTGHADDFARDGLAPNPLSKISRIDPAELPDVPEGTRIGACVGNVPNTFCIARNYGRHALEVGARPPDEPFLFQKATSSLNGPFDPIVLPNGSSRVDWEVELGLVIGQTAHHLTDDTALSHVAGYFTANDISERSWQKLGTGQWTKGKSAPSFCPIGPYLVTADDVPDPNDMTLSLTRNGKVMQSANTADMLFHVKELLVYLTRFIAMQPGDILLTGTPEGVGAGMDPQQFLHPGDVIETEVEGLGAMRNEIVAA